MRGRGRCGTLLVIGMMAGGVASAQTPAGEQAGVDATPTITTQTVLVRVPAMVQTKKREPVFTLKAKTSW